MTNCLMPDEAHAVWDLLVEKAGVSTDLEDRRAFVEYMTDLYTFGHEFRFMGLLGSGGKLYRNSRGVYVSCYPEDRNEVRDVIVAAVNARLDEMFAEAARP